jgi:hypothetical protein
MLSVYRAFDALPPTLHENQLKNFNENRRGFFDYESDRETSKLEGFADDGTVIAQATPEAIIAVKEILSDFEIISGLRCNVDKSVILPVGFGNALVPEYIMNCGFPVVEKVSILGVDITNNFDDLTGNFNAKIQKITNVRNFWSRFRLSLPGRVLVAKTFMLSQIGYLGCIIRPTAEQMRTMSEIINNFIKGTLNVSRDKITLPTEEGGVGMIKIDSFITALQASWVKKIRGKYTDNWRRDLLSFTGGEPIIANEALLRNTGSPILNEISRSLNEVKKCFYKQGTNLLESFLLFNPILNRFERNTTAYLTLKNNRPNLELAEITGLRVGHFWAAGTGMRRLDEICELTGLNISLISYMRLGGILTPACRHLNADPKPIGIGSLFAGTAKGSKVIRNVIQKAEINEKKLFLKKSRQVNTFFALIAIPVPAEPQLKFAFSIWSQHFIPNKIREFSFKFFNNLLGLNTRVAHFNLNINAGCTFCVHARGGEGEGAPRETFLHLFYECNHVGSIRTAFANKHLGDFSVRSDNDKKLFWFCGLINDTKNLTGGILALLINFYIWECKLRKTRMSLTSLENEINCAISWFFTLSRKMRLSCKKVNFPLFRDWATRYGEENGGRDSEDEEE